MQHLRRRSVQDGLFVLAAGIALLIYSLYEMTHARVKASWIMSYQHMKFMMIREGSFQDLMEWILQMTRLIYVIQMLT